MTKRFGLLSILNLAISFSVMAILVSCATSKKEEDQSPEKRSALLTEMGTGAYVRGDLPAAVEALQRAIVANPKNSGAHNNLGLAYLGLGQKELARKEFNQAIDIDNNPDAHINLGGLDESQNDFDGARKNYRAAIDNLTYHTRHRALTSMGSLELRLNNIDEARRWLYQSVQANPDFCATHQLLGMIYMRENNPHAAAGEFSKAIRSVCVRNVQSHYDLAQAYLKLKEYPKARKELTLLIENYPETLQGQKAGEDLKLVP